MFQSIKKHTLITLSFCFIILFSLPGNASPASLAEIYKKKGNDYYNNKQYAPAVEEYTKALMEDPDYAVVYYNRGMAFYDLHLYYKAIVDFDMAIMLEPNDKDFYFSRGIAYAKVDKLQLALADIKKAAGMGDIKASEMINNSELHRRIDKKRSKSKKIAELLGEKNNAYNRIVKITSRNNLFGGNTIVTTHSNGDPLYNGKEGIFKKKDYFNAQDILKKTELLHTAEFNDVNGRNKTVLWYSKESKIEKKEFFYTGKMLNIKGIHYYDKDNNLTKKALYDKHGKEISTKK